jgi:hypothetical protein
MKFGKFVTLRYDENIIHRMRSVTVRKSSKRVSCKKSAKYVLNKKSAKLQMLSRAAVGLCSLAGRYGNPMPEVNFIPILGLLGKSVVYVTKVKSKGHQTLLYAC